MHLHLRDGDMLNIVAPLSAAYFSAGIIMPNLVPPITDISELVSYKKRIQNACQNHEFEPLMTLFFRDDYDKKFLEKAKPYISAIKLYPAGITTNSSGGVSNINSYFLAKTLDAMGELEIPLCVHGESNGFVMDREAEFANIYEKLVSSFPKLKIIMEHITTKTSVDLLERYENLYATITLHHLYLTLDDVIGGMMNPHHFCKPIPKRPEDKEALLHVALNAHKKVMFGSDSAPHPIHKKECCGCAAGVFTSPIALPALCELFEKYQKLENLQAFISDNAQKIYNFKPPKKQIILEKKPFKVKKDYDGVVPLFAGEELSWEYL